MRRITVGLIAVGFGVVGGLAQPADATLINRCNVRAQVNLMPSPALTGDEDGSQPVECRGRPAGPLHWPTFDDLPEPEVDIYLDA